MQIKIIRNTPCAPFVLCLLCLFIVWGVDSAGAQDFITGTVLAVDIDRMEIELLPGPPDPVESDQQGKRSITARLSAENLVENRRGEHVFPGCVYPGGVIRIWGRMEAGIFIVSDIRGPGGHGQGDPTGVRRRLQRIGPGYCPGGWHGGGQ
jgi:hypothetical protein